MYLKKITDKDLAEAIGLSKSHLSLLITEKRKINHLQNYCDELGTDYTEHLNQTVRNAKIGVLLYSLINTERHYMIGIKKEKDTWYDELIRLNYIGHEYRDYINPNIIDELIWI